MRRRVWYFNKNIELPDYPYYVTMTEKEGSDKFLKYKKIIGARNKTEAKKIQKKFKQNKNYKHIYITKKISFYPKSDYSLSFRYPSEIS